MQHHTFMNNRGGVFHRVHLPGSVKRFSVWYDEKGDLVDAEGYDALDRACPPNVYQRDALKRFLKRYLD